ncbi:MAG: hypothetical protein UW09_C0001G0272 [candidate division TM6 bacterium GW2011_GWF2_43_87]|nr:MAG: hypothetical protein UW09_C0001G0272 [candidate division TM6 bacterium GW2011_GWF2_43_87]
MICKILIFRCEGFGRLGCYYLKAQTVDTVALNDASFNRVHDTGVWGVF